MGIKSSSWGRWSARLLLSALPLCALADDQKFDIGRYALQGNHLISSADIAARIQRFTGDGRVFADIQRAIETIEAMYQEHGYAGVQVSLPEQEINAGTVRIDITEAVIGKINITGNRHFSNENIRAALPSLRQGETPNIRQISENVQLANENPARQMDVVLGIGANSDELEAKLAVKDKSPWGVYLSADNTGNRQTGRDRIGIALQHANLFNADHVATVAYTTSVEQPERTKLYSLSYRLPIYAWGDSIDVIAGYSDVNAGTSATVAGPLQFSGRGRVYGLRYNHILPRQGTFSHRFVFGLDQKEYDNTCTLGGDPICGAGGADVTVRPVSVTYSGQWDTPGHTTQFSGTLLANAAGGPHGRQSDFTASRLDTAKDYQIFRGNLSHGRTLPGDWQIRGNLALQYTPQALVAGEQQGLVGNSAVRGFQERIVSADKGYLGSLELYTPNLASLAPANGSLRFLAFFDWGHGSFNKRPPGNYESETVASTGVGLRYALGQQVSLRFDTARVVNGGPNGTAQAGDWRGHVNLTLGF